MSAQAIRFSFFSILFGVLAVLSLILSFAFRLTDKADRPVSVKEEAPGVYQGIIPCADCSGIEIVMYLYPDGAYFQTSTYFDEDSRQYLDTGTWEIDGSDRLKLTTGSEESQYYQVETDRIYFLDTDGGEMNTGKLRDFYQLFEVAQF